MGNKIAATFLVAVFVIIALLSTATSVGDSAATVLTTNNNSEIEQFHEIVKKGEVSIMNCILVIVCLIVGFLLGRMGSNIYDGLIVLDRGTGRTVMNLDLADDVVSRCRFITLKVVNKDEEGDL